MTWLKIRHPNVKTNGIHHIKPGTEIILQSGGWISLGNRVSTQKRVVFSTIGGGDDWKLNIFQS